MKGWAGREGTRPPIADAAAIEETPEPPRFRRPFPRSAAMAAEPALPANSPPPPRARHDGRRPRPPAPPPSDAHWSAAAANWATDDADWCVPRSDEEEEEEEGGGWAPAPPEIRRLLELIAQRGTLELRRPARPRRPPTPLREAAPACESSEEPPQERPDKPPVVPQFEFEDEPVAPQRPLIDRRRAHGAGRVARRAALDKVLWDMKRHQALEQQILRTGLDLFPPGARARAPPDQKRVFRPKNGTGDPKKRLV
ncbi:hypothetical protein Q9966_016764 [Columba livia]|nr:hypothetical protein Q9966_016764 [Columba livia]KAK2510976.1 hypothetical protein Q9966_016764 [Columba livia]KAK2510977.1 hypothetical protein Q9966_016764 [Columba livia]